MKLSNCLFSLIKPEKLKTIKPEIKLKADQNNKVKS